MNRFMLRRKLIVPALSVAMLLVSQAVVPFVASASPLHPVVPVHAKFGTKMVHLSLANNTTSAVEIMVGETPMSIAPGQTVKVNISAGTKIVMTAASGTHEAGSVLAQVSNEMSGATIRIN